MNYSQQLKIWNCDTNVKNASENIKLIYKNRISNILFLSHHRQYYEAIAIYRKCANTYKNMAKTFYTINMILHNKLCIELFEKAGNNFLNSYNLLIKYKYVGAENAKTKDIIDAGYCFFYSKLCSDKK